VEPRLFASLLEVACHFGELAVEGCAVRPTLCGEGGRFRLRWPTGRFTDQVDFGPPLSWRPSLAACVRRALGHEARLFWLRSLAERGEVITLG